MKSKMSKSNLFLLRNYQKKIKNKLRKEQRKRYLVEQVQWMKELIDFTLKL